MKRLLICFLFQLLLPSSAICAESVKPEAVVATFGDTPIYAEEMILHIRDNVALVAVHFKSRHNADLSGEGWLKKINGEIPLDLLKDRAVHACRVSKAIQLLAVENGGGDKLQFPGFAQVSDEVNQARAKGKAKERILYGLVNYSPAQLYKYKLTNLRNHLRDRNMSQGFDQRENDIQAAIEAKIAAMPVKLEGQIVDRLLAEQVGAR